MKIASIVPVRSLPVWGNRTSYLLCSCAALAVACLVFISAAAASGGYTVSLLDSTSALLGSPRGINIHGQVCGKGPAFLWTPANGMTQIPLLPGADSMYGVALNDSGTVVGWVSSGTNWTSFIWDSVHGSRSIAGMDEAYDINDKGQIVGTCDGDNACMLSNGAVSEIPGGNAPRAINEVGQVVGGDWLYSDAVVEELPLPYVSFEALDINNRGEVVGRYWSSTDYDADCYAFLWDATNGARTLGSCISDSGGTRYVSVNNLGQVVWSDTLRSYIWDSTNGTRTLPLLPGSTRSVVTGINDVGQIIGTSGDNVCIWNPVTEQAAPTIRSFAPTAGGAGTTVTITGTNFTGAISVKFNGVAAASFTVKSATSITAVVPKTTTGKISVTTSGGTARSAAWFTFCPAPAITSFSPAKGGVGTSVTITGTNLTGATSVKFNGVTATSYGVVSASSIIAVVPRTTTGRITVTTRGGVAASTRWFTFVPAPTITSFTPRLAGAGATVTITGTNLTGTTSVRFNGVAAASFSVKSSTSIVAVVPKTTTGKISVTTPGGTATSAAALSVAARPTIISFRPGSAGAGTVVTIVGTNFTGATSVKFNGVAATSFRVVSATWITAVVPKTTQGKITVTTPGGTATSAEAIQLGGVAVLIAEGKDKLNRYFMSDPYSTPTPVTLLDGAYTDFLQARSLSPADPDANMGLAIAKSAGTAQMLLDKYTDYMWDGRAGVASLKTAINALQIFKIGDSLSSEENAVSTLVSDYGKLAQTLVPAYSYQASMMLEIQADIQGKILPALADIGNLLTAVETNAASIYTFPIGSPSWERYTLLDKGDIYLFHGRILTARWSLAIPASYCLDTGSFQWCSPIEQDANGDGLLAPTDYLPGSTFGTLLPTGAATMAGSKTDMIVACSKTIAGIDATLAETSDDYDLIPSQTMTARSGLLTAKAFATQVNAAMSASTDVTYVDYNGSTVVSVFPGAWAVTPPADLKAVFPTKEITRWFNLRPIGYSDPEYSTQDLVPDGYADTTIGGLFPKGAPALLLSEDRRVIVHTDGDGDPAAAIYPQDGDAVSTDPTEFEVIFDGTPPADFSVLLQRVVDGKPRAQDIFGPFYQDGCYRFRISDFMWPNSYYQIVFRNEVTKDSTVVNFTTGSYP